MPYYSRKSPRIPNYDYSRENYYFITFCTYNMKCIFGTPTVLNRFGLIAQEHLLDIEKHYQSVHLDKFVVMPNHIHMILVLNRSGEADAEQIVAQYKSGVTRQIRKIAPGMKVWQRSFHDRVIRNQENYEKIWRYIEGNPQCWDKDCFYTK